MKIKLYWWVSALKKYEIPIRFSLMIMKIKMFRHKRGYYKFLRIWSFSLILTLYIHRSVNNSAMELQFDMNVIHKSVNNSAMELQLEMNVIHKMFSINSLGLETNVVHIFRGWTVQTWQGPVSWSSWQCFLWSSCRTLGPRRQSSW